MAWISLDPWKLLVFIQACIRYATLGHLKLDSESMICFYEECLCLVCFFGYSWMEVTLYIFLGESNQKIQKFTESICYLNKALETALRTNDIDGMARGLAELGVTHGLSGEYSKAVSYLDECLKIALETDDRMVEALAYRSFGIVYQSKGEFLEAIKFHKKQLKISQEDRDKIGEVLAYANLEESYTSLGNCQEATKCHIESEKAYLASKMGHERKEKLARELLGKSYSQMGKRDEASDKTTELAVTKALGRKYEALGKRSLAVKHYERLQMISTELGNKEAQCFSYQKLSNNYLCLADYRKAIKNEENYLGKAKESGDRINEGRSCGSLGYLYDQLGKYEKGAYYNEKAIRIAIETSDREGEGRAYLGLCRNYPLRKKYQEAIKYAKKALAIAREIGDKQNEGYSLNVLGLAYTGKCIHDEAIICYRESLEIAEKIDDKGLEGCVQSNLGTVFMLVRQHEMAIKHFEKSIIIDKLLNRESSQHITYDYLAKTYYYLGIESLQTRLDIRSYKDSMSKSIKYFREALKCCDRIFDKLKERDDLKISVMETFIHIHKWLIKVLLEEEKFEDALLVCEQGKARALSDLFVSRYHQVPLENAPQSVQLEYSEVQAVLSESDACVLYSSLLLTSLASWVMAPNYLRNTTKDLKLTVKCNDPNEVIREVVGAAYVKMEIENDVQCENRSLESLEPFHKDTAKKMSRSTDETNFPNPLEPLWNFLRTPLTYVSQNSTQENLIIVPDGPLYMVPFAALKDPKTGLFLSEMKRIRLVPSLKTLKSLQECPSDYHSKTGALVVGDPDSGAVMFQGKETTFSPLPEARREATVIGNILGVEPLLGAQATKDFIKQRLHEGVAVIHIAAHGSTKGEIVLAPGTLTGARKIPEEEDYLLTMQEVQETGMRAQLVVLSCCHSGRGEIRAEGIVGISRGFLAAGARAVVASLWAIDDEATLNFMVSFYTFLKMGESASKSLQQAMKDLREDEAYKEPRHWAPFFLIGDDVTINFQK